MSNASASLKNLGADILVMIAEELYENVPQNLVAFRSTCQDFNQFAVPLFFRQIKFNARMLEEVETMRKNLRGSVCRNLRHVVIGDFMPWEDLVLLLDDCERLSDMTWIFGWQPTSMRWFPVPLRTLCERRPHIRLALPNLQAPDLILPFVRNFCHPTATIPPLNVISISVYLEETNGKSFLPLQDLLMSCNRLEVLRLFTEPALFKPMERKFPPIKQFTAKMLVWRYSLEDTNLIWDFSRLEHLDLTWWILSTFFKIVPLDTLKHLKTLLIDYHDVSEKNVKASGDSYEKRMEHLKAQLIAASSNHIVVRAYNVGDTMLRFLAAGNLVKGEAGVIEFVALQSTH